MSIENIKLKHKLSRLKKLRDYYEKKWKYYEKIDKLLSEQFLGKYYSLYITIKYLEDDKSTEEFFEEFYEEVTMIDEVKE